MIRNKKFVVNDNGHCRLCTSPDGEDSMVACDQCDHWFHQQCTGLKNLPGPTEKWLCIQCSEYEVVMTTMTNKMNQMKMELDERAKAHRRSEVHSSSLELELEKYKEELLKAKKEEDSKQDVLKGLADVLQRSKSRSDESLDDNRVSEGRVLSVLMRRQLQSLPTFSGIAREWPIYKRRFLETTESGEYSDSENLIRLQQSLSGAAARSVQALMLDPSNVQQILDRLERQFGQFQKIYKELRDDIDRVKLSGLHTIIDMSDALENLVSHLEAMKKPEYLRDPRMTEDIVSKLPYEMQIKWLETTSSNDPGVRTLRDLLNFIKPRADVLREMGRALPERRNRVNLHQEAVKRCFVCDREHQIKYCSKFRGMAALERIRLVHANGRCQICLRKHKDQCRSYAHCGINGCNGKHHPMLHLKRSPGYNNRRSRNFDSANRKSPTEVAQTNLHYQVPSQVFYQIIPVTIRNGPYQIKTYAFLDPGSSLTLIDSYIADQLKLEGTPAPLKIKWTQNFSKEEKHSTRVQFELEGTSGEKFCVRDVRTVDNLQLPVQTLDYQEMSRDYHHLRRLPIKSFKRAQPKLLIGLNQSHLLLPIDRKYDGPNKPIAIETPLGWLIFGNISGDIHEDHIMIIQEEGEDEENLRQMMQNYFSVEDFGVKVPEVLPESKEITRAKEIIDKTLKYDGNRYEVGLLWREDNTVLPESYTQAYKRLMNEETRFKNKPDVKVWMNATIKEYLDKGYIRKLSQEELEAWEKEIYYLPHFIVYNKNKVPPKPRLVFDAAAKNKGVSLNSVLLAGPDATTSSFGVTTRFREGKYATAGDIKEMFCQIKIIAEDQKKQCFLFRDFDVTRKPDVYTMQVMTFGATCSPACAQIVKNYNAEQFKEIKPKAAKAIETQHYVDDYIDSFNSVEEAIETIKDVTEIHQKAGFYIRNFVSNDKNILTALPQERVQGSPLKQLEDKDSLNEKVLGVYWNTASDSIGFELHFNRLPEAVSNGARPPTMREVLSFVMSIYDPMGLISHLTIHGKILMQKLHVEMTDWDEEISPQSQQQWKQWLTNIARAQEIRIPRWILCNQAKVFELHVFVDASEYAFATAIYTRGIGAYGQTVSVKLVAAKAKVAPVRKLSIPRLELQAAILGARLAQTIQQELRIVPSRTTYWSDSQTVLSWIHSDHRKYKQFVAHRVGEILDTTKMDQWRYVPTGQNPADEGTKEVKGKSKWLTGPTFLWNEEKDWPKSKFNMNTLEEIKDAVMVHDYDQRSFDFINEWRYSDWNKLLKNTTYLKKFTDWVKNKKDFDRTITYNDRVMAENTILQKAQWENFTNEMNDLKRNNDLTISSSIATLIPTLDEHGVMRARSRLQNAISIPQSARMPIILPHEHYISKLIVKSYHERYLHQGDNVVLGAIRQKYWIIKARALLKKIKRECQYCKNKRAAPVAPQMAPLPPCRTAMYAYPFTHTGVDYFGPIEVQVKRSIEKRWGVIFTCMSTRATHVELAERLDTDAFLVCLKNFQNRRGKVQHLYSDNGTNFVGAEKEMKAAIDEIDKKFGGSIAATMEINWTFNPPAAPHFGGAWERLIQSIKKCLKAMPECTQMRKPTIEELRSALIQAEFILNSRPLTHISLDNEDEEPLTPFHFLIGRAGEYAPPYSIPTGCLTKKQYERINLYSQHFWERWQKEYLPTLVKRNKWTKKVEPLKEGDVVLITDKETHPGKWLKGRIVEIRRAADGQVRSAQVKTIQGIYSRPATKIAVLDVRRKEEDKKEEPHASINHMKEISTKEHGEINKPKPKPQPPKTNDKTAPPIQAKRIKYPKIKDICIVNHHREVYAQEELPTSSKATRKRKPTELEWAKNLRQNKILNPEKIMKSTQLESPQGSAKSNFDSWGKRRKLDVDKIKEMRDRWNDKVSDERNQRSQTKESPPKKIRFSSGGALKALMMLFCIGTVFASEPSGLIAYDCANPDINMTSYSLLDVDSCIPTVKNLTTTEVPIQVLQRSAKSSAMVYQCKVIIKRIVKHCGIHSHTSDYERRYAYIVKEFTPEECKRIHLLGTLPLTVNAGLSELKRNHTTRGETLVVGSVWSSHCSGGVYKTPEYTWLDALVYFEYEVALYNYVATVDHENDQILLRHGIVCPYSHGKCLDSEDGYSTWEVSLDRRCEDTEFEVIYEGSVNKTTNEDGEHKSNQAVYTAISDSHLFSIRTKQATQICGYKGHATDHPRIFILESSSFKSPFNRRPANVRNHDLFTYFNSKITLVENYIGKRLDDVYRTVMTEMCKLDKALLETKLTLARINPMEFVTSIMRRSGFSAVVAGEVLHVLQCKPVYVQPFASERCYQELPVKYGNDTMFLTPVTRTLQMRGTEIECTPLLPAKFQFGGRWYTFDGKIRETIPPQKLATEIVTKWRYTPLPNLMESGIYDQESIQKMRTMIYDQGDRRIASNVVHKMLTGQSPNRQGFHFEALVSEKVIDNVINKYWNKIISLSTALGNFTSTMIGLYLLGRCVKFLIDTIMHGRILYDIYGFGWQLIASFWDSMTSFLSHRNTLRNINRKKHEVASTELEEIRVTLLPESQQTSQPEIRKPTKPKKPIVNPRQGNPTTSQDDKAEDKP